MKETTEIKKSPPHLLKRFAVCDIPLYDICDYNVTRDQCRQLGCCFYKGVCYEKAVPIYVQVFFSLIAFVAGVFVFAVGYRVVRGLKRKPAKPPEEPKKPVPKPSIPWKPPTPTPSPSPIPTPVPPPTPPPVKKTESPVEGGFCCFGRVGKASNQPPQETAATVTPSKPEENKDAGGSAAPQSAP